MARRRAAGGARGRRRPRPRHRRRSSPRASPRSADRQRAVTVFGSARTPPRAPRLRARARASARASARAGYAVITGGGPGLMEAANRGARRRARCRSAATSSCPTSRTLNPYLDIGLRFEHFFARKVMFVRYASAFVDLPRRLRHARRAVRVLTLIQTRHDPPLPGDPARRRRVGGPARRGCATGPLADGRIDARDLELLQLVDDARAGVRRSSRQAYARQLADGADVPRRTRTAGEPR